MSLLKHEITYHSDSARLFSRIADRPWAIFLDSGQAMNPATGRPGSQYGRYDILVADPFITLRTTQNGLQTSTEISQNGMVSISHDDPFSLLNITLAPYQGIQHEVPFAGGALGYFSYDLARQIESLPQIASADAEAPHMMIGIYDWAVVVDHREKKTYLVSYAQQEATRATWTALCSLFDTPITPRKATFVLNHAISSNMDFSQYSQAFHTIKHYIAAGDCYQVNLAQRFSAKAQGDAWIVYEKLRELSPAPFMAYMNFDGLQVLSASPERFLQVQDGHVETRPIKGTRPRSADPVLDQSYAQSLQDSGKDRAENLMIVDLLRNDISKNCMTGSVKVGRLFQLQSFANVHHLVSIVTARLAVGKTAIDLLRGCFPGGSITGAPKLRAMQIIEALEPHRRGVYCGVIGYIDFNGNMDTNIAIRTAVYTKNILSFYAGGGIVADSNLEQEYTETLDKAAGMLETMQFFRRADE